ncbi:hypothetical protein; putative exported protein [Frankia alni ACN14a]|uniref:Uncharacterized protein n=1 Tax=Frankia alni (strain DSM 45986 / CECT 9034 / ACN14a) TaxID=326424 RepID=Q0RAL2_FRAAA|nr:hypothetical protein; putative exported protein [Frankia alni ACN14a]
MVREPMLARGHARLGPVAPTSAAASVMAAPTVDEVALREQVEASHSGAQATASGTITERR